MKADGRGNKEHWSESRGRFKLSGELHIQHNVIKLTSN